jgi:hypothetical protein
VGYLIRSLAAIVLAGLSCTSVAAELQFRIEPRTSFSDAMRQVVDGGQFMIYATGEIDDGAPARLKAFVRANGIDWAKVIFDSPGGSLLGGMRLGAVIRELEFDTSVGREGEDLKNPKGAVCASACAYAFAGGVNRYYSAYNKERLGLHQFYAEGDNQGDLGEAQQISGLLVAYLQRMGVDASAFSVASLTSGDSMTWLSVEDALKLGLANNGAQQTTARIKLSNKMPYLQLEQIRQEGTARIVIACPDKAVRFAAFTVTNAEISRRNYALATRSYLEDGQGVEWLGRAGKDGLEVIDQSLVIDRILSSQDVLRLLKIDELSMWVDGPNLRYGTSIDLKPVRKDLAEYLKSCYGG